MRDLNVRDEHPHQLHRQGGFELPVKRSFLAPFFLWRALGFWSLQFDAEIFADSLDEVGSGHHKGNLYHLVDRKGFL